VIKAPIALALVRKPEGELLCLQGLGKVDLPGDHVTPGVRLEVVLERKLASLGIHAPRLFFRWGAVCVWRGDQRPVQVFEARGWTGTPSDVCSWATEEEIAKGPRQLLYRHLFEKLSEGGASAEAGTLIAEGALFTKPQTFCPRCGSAMKLRRRRPTDPAAWDCRSCASGWQLAAGSLMQIPAIGA